VKVRGFRVELGEVEAVLSAHESVREAVAIAREDGSGVKRVVAYVVGEAGAALTGGALREHMRERVPEYMVPSYFVMLERLPLTPNGKVDKRSLPEPEAGEAAQRVEYVKPRTHVEEKVSEMWAEVLKVERVGVFDDFFDLGGHSLLATQVMSRVRREFGVEVALRELFESPTVAALAEAVEKAKAAGAESKVPALAPVSRQARRVRQS
jgi:acyl carrier protein